MDAHDDGGPPLPLMEEWVASSPHLHELHSLVTAAATSEPLQAPVTEVRQARSCVH